MSEQVGVGVGSWLKDSVAYFLVGLISMIVHLEVSGRKIRDN